MTKRITTLIDRMASTANGLAGVLWSVKYHAGDKEKMNEQVKTLQVQIENLQADLNELKEVTA